MDYQGGPSVIAKVLIKRRQEGRREVGGVRTKAEIGMMPPQTKESGWFLEARKGKEMHSRLKPPGRTILDDTLILAS